MKREITSIGMRLLLVLAAACAAGACRPVSDGSTAAAGKADAPRADGTMPAGKPTAPVDIDYDVIGAAFVGQPISIEIELTSSLRDRPITLAYRINDPRDLTFAESQPQRVSVSAIGDAPSARRQVTVIPQREGRLYLNVSAEVETEAGTLIKSMAIPVQVGGARGEPDANGELKEDADGDPVISLPAEESPR